VRERTDSVLENLNSWSFEATVAKIYELIGKPKADYNKLEQLGVSATAG
jgi:solute carrier family 25 phosphate transporter 3